MSENCVYPKQISYRLAPETVDLSPDFGGTHLLICFASGCDACQNKSSADHAGAFQKEIVKDTNCDVVHIIGTQS